MKQMIFISIALFGFLFIACQQKEAAPTPQPSEPAAAAPVASQSTAETGAIEGAVLYSGQPPKGTKNPAKSVSECQATDADENHKSIRVKSGKLMNVFVYIASGLPTAKYEIPQTPVVLDQDSCAYQPRVLGVRVGQTLQIKNSDNTLHNVHAVSATSQSFNMGMPTKGMESKKVFNKSEIMMPIKCDVHPWMRAFVGIMDHPFFAVSDENGAFKIPNLPAGKYSVVAWHEKLGTLKQDLDVTPGKPTAISFTFAGQ